MDLDRGALARLSRRLLAGLDRDQRFQMVRVPVTPAEWSTWKRFCDTAGISMGRAIAALIDHDMASVFDNSSEGAVSMFEEQGQRQLVDREAAFTRREGELSAAKERVPRWSEHLRGWEHELDGREWRVEAATKLPTHPAQVRAKTGRNERCPCGSDLKSKRRGLPWTPDHHNHIHVDNSLTVGVLDTSHKATVRFIQAACDNLNGASLMIDGVWGSQTSAAFNAANVAMCFNVNVFTSSTAWKDWCSMIAKHGFRDKALGFYKYSTSNCVV